MINKITAFFTAFVIFLGSISLISEPAIPEACSENELLSLEGVIEKKELGDEVFAIDIGGYSYEEKLTAISLQGIVAQKNPSIVLIRSWIDKEYLKNVEQSGIKVNYETLNLASLIEKFKSYVSGYILYRESEFAEGLNVATNYATVNG